jgi:uncharacterized protein YjbI with pentapeptide repeats
MDGETITPENFSTIEWDDNYFKYCDFEGLSPEGGHIASDFSSCSFKNIDWYKGLFNICNFMECRFTNCIFLGTSFPNCKFVECTFTNCQFLKNNMNSDCSFEQAIAYACRIENCVGFGALQVSVPAVPPSEN